MNLVCFSCFHSAPLPSPENPAPDTCLCVIWKLIFKGPFSGIHPPPLPPPQESRKNPACQTFSNHFFMHAVPTAYSYAFLPAVEVLAVLVLKFHLKYNSPLGLHTEISVKEPPRFRVPANITMTSPSSFPAISRSNVVLAISPCR